MDLHTGKIQPQQVELEEIVLGALLLEGDAVKRVSDLLTPDVFYKTSHNYIYTAISELNKDNLPIDILTVSDKLRKNGQLEMVGGAYYITMLTSRIASASNLEYHSFILVQEWMRRKAIELSNEINNKAYDETTDILATLDFINEFTKQIQDKYFNKTIEPDEIVKLSIKELEKRIENRKSGINNSIPTPVNCLNERIVGAEKGELIILAARPSMGKTQFALKWAEAAVCADHNALIFSLEMTALELVNRRICSYSGTDTVDYRAGRINPVQMDKVIEACEKVKKYPIFIEDRCYSLSNIKSKARQHVLRNFVELIIIDYLQLIERPGKNDNSEIEKISRELKLLSLELNIPIIALSQLNRECEKTGTKIPSLHHLRDSGAIEQDADIVIFLYRPSVYGIVNFDFFGSNYMGMDRSDIFAIIPKFRNGEIGHVHFKCLDRVSGFLDKHDYENMNRNVDMF